MSASKVERDMLRAGIRTAKRLGIRTQAHMSATERDADTWIAVLLADDLLREFRTAETIPAPSVTKKI